MKDNLELTQAAEIIAGIKAEIAKAFIGQRTLVDHVLTSLIAGGHILLEGQPGLGKTLLVRAIAEAIGGDSRRIQFTPDLMPSDITGHIMLDQSRGGFITKKGPVFTNFLVADEINRAPAKTQAALFEAMQEYQVSLDGNAHQLPVPFMTLATQNPFEHEGTYPLPDAQKDRFLMKVLIAYPQHDEETEMVGRVLASNTGARLSTADIEAVTSPEAFCRIQDLAASLLVDPAIIDYAVRICARTRGVEALQSGAGPRGSLALIRCARAVALCAGRDFVLPDDIKELAVPILAHRVTLSAESEIEGWHAERIIAKILEDIEAPRS